MLTDKLIANALSSGQYIQSQYSLYRVEIGD